MIRFALVAVVILACSAPGGPVIASPDPVRTGSPRPAGDLGAYFDRPPEFPGYAWTYKGQPVDTTHGMNTIAAAGHCGWQAATLMHLPWPLGIAPASGADVRQFVRDAKRVVPQRNLRGPLDLHATLPADAAATGYRYQSIEVYLSPADQDVAVYVVGPSAVERWPRSDPMTLCV